MPKHITYELPLNERIRTILRLEFLFSQMAYSIHGVSSWDSRNSISSLLEIKNVISRSDLRNELTKEMQRHKKAMESLFSIPGVDINILKNSISSLENCLYDLNSVANNTDKESPNEFLKTIQQRDSIPGGTCDFDIPLYHFWLNQSEQQRIKMLASWLSHYEQYSNAINLILNNLRNSTIFKKYQAKNGFYQQSLDSKSPYQLIRVQLDSEADFYAELSGGKHRFSIRFMLPNYDIKSSPALNNIEFSLSCCIL